MAKAAQLEMQLNFIVLMHQIDISEPRTRTELDELRKKVFSKTMGQTIFELKRLGLATPEEAEQLTRAREQRNRLAHEYFREYAWTMFSPETHSQVATELDDIEREFDRLWLKWQDRNYDWISKRELFPSDDQGRESEEEAELRVESERKSEEYTRLIYEHLRTEGHARSVPGPEAGIIQSALFALSRQLEERDESGESEGT